MLTMNEIRMANIRAGQHFFDSDTMRFFDSRIDNFVAEGPGGVYFVTSEQFHGSDGYHAPRRFTVRQFNPEDGHAWTPSEFNKLDTVEEARAAAATAAAGSEVKA